MQLSIVIPAKNEEVLLPRLLQSIRAQTFTDYEVIVADAQSTDRTCEIAASFGATVVAGGLPGEGRNVGAKIAIGAFLFFLDADTMLPHPHFLKACLSEICERRLDVATCRVQADRGRWTERAGYEAFNLLMRATQYVFPHALGSALLVRREAHQALNGFDEEVIYAEDFDYVQRVPKIGLHFGVLASRVSVSVRRIRKEGLWRLLLKYSYGEARTIFFGSFTHRSHPPFRYEFGHYAPEHQLDAP